VEPLMVVGFEGLFGVAAMAVILAIVQFLPGKEGTGLREDSIESWQMIRASPVRSPLWLLCRMPSCRLLNNGPNPGKQGICAHDILCTAGADCALFQDPRISVLLSYVILFTAYAQRCYSAGG